MRLTMLLIILSTVSAGIAGLLDSSRLQSQPSTPTQTPTTDPWLWLWLPPTPTWSPTRTPTPTPALGSYNLEEFQEWPMVRAYRYPFPTADELDEFVENEVWLTQAFVFYSLHGEPEPGHLQPDVKVRKQTGLSIPELDTLCHRDNMIGFSYIPANVFSFAICPRFFSLHYHLKPVRYETEDGWLVAYDLAPGQTITLAPMNFRPRVLATKFNGAASIITAYGTAGMEYDRACKPVVDMTVREILKNETSVEAVRLRSFLENMAGDIPEDLMDFLKNSRYIVLMSEGVIDPQTRVIWWQNPECTWLNIRGPGRIALTDVRTAFSISPIVSEPFDPRRVYGTRAAPGIGVAPFGYELHGEEASTPSASPSPTASEKAFEQTRIGSRAIFFAVAIASFAVVAFYLTISFVRGARR